jgi:hypothetical protein
VAFFFREEFRPRYPFWKASFSLLIYPPEDANQERRAFRNGMLNLLESLANNYFEES